MAIDYKLLNSLKLVNKILIALQVFFFTIGRKHVLLLAEDEIMYDHVLLDGVLDYLVDFLGGFDELLNFVLECFELEFFLVVFAELVDWLTVTHVLVQ